MELFSFYQSIALWTTVLLVVTIWDLVWKALAMWRAAGRKEVIWFVALLLLNTAGILPILYMVFKSKPGAVKKSVVSGTRAALNGAASKVATGAQKAVSGVKNVASKKSATKDSKGNSGSLKQEAKSKKASRSKKTMIKLYIK